ncbi:hypothetical protein ACVXHB_08065 [Escherichia coli]
MFYGSAIPELGEHCRMRRLPRLSGLGNVLNVGRIRRLRRIRQVTPNLTDDVPASPLSVPQIYYSSQ